MLEPKKPKDAYRVYELVEGALSSRVDFGDVTNTGNERLLRAAPASVFDGEVDCSGGCYPLAGSKTLSLQSDAGAFDVSGSRALLGRLSPFRAINHDKSDNWKARLHPELEEGLFLVDEDAMFFTFLKNGKLHVLPRDPGDASDEYHGSKRDEEDDDAVKQRRFVWSLDEARLQEGTGMFKWKGGYAAAIPVLRARGVRLLAGTKTHTKSCVASPRRERDAGVARRVYAGVALSDRAGCIPAGGALPPPHLLPAARHPSCATRLRRALALDQAPVECSP